VAPDQVLACLLPEVVLTVNVLSAAQQAELAELFASLGITSVTASIHTVLKALKVMRKHVLDKSINVGNVAMFTAFSHIYSIAGKLASSEEMLEMLRRELSSEVAPLIYMGGRDKSSFKTLSGVAWAGRAEVLATVGKTPLEMCYDAALRPFFAALLGSEEIMSAKTCWEALQKLSQGRLREDALDKQVAIVYAELEKHCVEDAVKTMDAGCEVGYHILTKQVDGTLAVVPCAQHGDSDTASVPLINDDNYMFDVFKTDFGHWVYEAQFEAAPALLGALTATREDGPASLLRLSDVLVSKGAVGVTEPLELEGDWTLWARQFMYTKVHELKHVRQSMYKGCRSW
jgi:hypothetical protein